MPLTRLKDSAFDAQVEGVYFGMWNGSIPVRCLVSQEALTDKAEEASLAESLDVFHEYRSEIENLASAKYDAGQIKSDGLVVVDSADLNPEQFQQGLALNRWSDGPARLMEAKKPSGTAFTPELTWLTRAEATSDWCGLAQRGRGSRPPVIIAWLAMIVASVASTTMG